MEKTDQESIDQKSPNGVEIKLPPTTPPPKNHQPEHLDHSNTQKTENQANKTKKHKSPSFEPIPEVEPGYTKSKPTQSKGDSNLLLTNPYVVSAQQSKANYFEVNLVDKEVLIENIHRRVNMEDISIVKFDRISSNILDALNFLHKSSRKDKDPNSTKDRIRSWKEKLKSPHNQQIINDGFWLIVLKKNKDKFLDKGTKSKRKRSKRFEKKKKLRKIEKKLKIEKNLKI